MLPMFEKDVHDIVNYEIARLSNLIAFNDLKEGNPIRKFPSVDMLPSLDDLKNYHWVYIPLDIKEDPARFHPSYIPNLETEGKIENTIRLVLEEGFDCVYNIGKDLGFGFTDLDKALTVKLSV